MNNVPDPNLSSSKNAKLADLCPEDKQKIGLMVKSLASKITEERLTNAELKSKYENALIEFEEVKKQINQNNSDPYKSIKNRVRNISLLDTDSDQEHFISDINKCATQSSFQVHSRETESFIKEIPQKVVEDRIQMVKRQEGKDLSSQAIAEITKLREEVQRLSMSIQELNISSAEKKSHSRLNTFQNK